MCGVCALLIHMTFTSILCVLQEGLMTCQYVISTGKQFLKSKDNVDLNKILISVSD